MVLPPQTRKMFLDSVCDVFGETCSYPTPTHTVINTHPPKQEKCFSIRGVMFFPKVFRLRVSKQSDARRGDTTGFSDPKN